MPLTQAVEDPGFPGSPPFSRTPAADSKYTLFSGEKHILSYVPALTDCIYSSAPFPITYAVIEMIF